jgi:hypothetical protein
MVPARVSQSHRRQPFREFARSGVTSPYPAPLLDLGVHHPLRELPDHLPQQIGARLPDQYLQPWERARLVTLARDCCACSTAAFPQLSTNMTAVGSSPEHVERALADMKARAMTDTENADELPTFPCHIGFYRNAVHTAA